MDPGAPSGPPVPPTYFPTSNPSSFLNPFLFLNIPTPQPKICSLFSFRPACSILIPPTHSHLLSSHPPPAPFPFPTCSLPSPTPELMHRHAIIPRSPPLPFRPFFLPPGPLGSLPPGLPSYLPGSLPHPSAPSLLPLHLSTSFSHLLLIRW